MMRAWARRTSNLARSRPKLVLRNVPRRPHLIPPGAAATAGIELARGSAPSSFFEMYPGGHTPLGNLMRSPGTSTAKVAFDLALAKLKIQIPYKRAAAILLVPWHWCRRLRFAKCNSTLYGRRLRLWMTSTPWMTWVRSAIYDRSLLSSAARLQPQNEEIAGRADRSA